MFASHRASESRIASGPVDEEVVPVLYVEDAGRAVGCGTSGSASRRSGSTGSSPASLGGARLFRLSSTGRNTSPASLMRIDPRTNGVVATLWPTSLRSELASVHGLLWVAGERLLGLDAHGRIVRQAQLPRMVAGVAAQDDHLWAIDACGCAVGRLLRIDLRQGHVSAAVKVGQTPVLVAVGYGAIWVANFEDSSLSRIPY